VRKLTVAATGCFVAQAPATCQCNSLSLYHKHGTDAINTSDIYCAADRDVIPQSCVVVEQVDAVSRQCQANEIPFRCPLGPISPSGPITLQELGWSFELVAQVVGDQGQCEQGQFNRGTFQTGVRGGELRTVASAVAETRPAAGNYAFAPGGNFAVRSATSTLRTVPPHDAPPDGEGRQPFGADNYTGPFTFSRRFVQPAAGRTRVQYNWVDIPAALRLTANIDAVMQQDEFVSWVRGTNTCWCQFRIAHQWRRNGGHSAIGGGEAPTGVEIIAGNECYDEGSTLFTPP
jgi:hypothetical protein